MAAAISGLVLAGVLATSFHVSRSGIRLASYSEMTAQVSRALEQFGGEARSATDLVWNNEADVTLSVPDANGTVSLVTYAWRADTKSFLRVPGASSATTAGRTVLVRDLPSNGSAPGVTFDRLNRSGATVTTTTAAKFIRVSFTLSRTGSAVGTSSERASAVFALRNKPGS